MAECKVIHPDGLETEVRSGSMTRLAGVSGRTEDVTYVKGPRMRQDSGDSSTIMDFSTGEMIFLDHAARTYSRFSLGDLAEFSERMAEAMQVARAELDEEEWEDEEEWDDEEWEEETDEAELSPGLAATSGIDPVPGSTGT
jgi:hypothetical protein